MKTYLLSSVDTETIDTSDFGTGPSRLIGDVTFSVQRWDDKPGVFNTSEVKVSISRLPDDLRIQFTQFHADLVSYLETISA